MLDDAFHHDVFRARRGDREALDRILGRHHDRVAGLVRDRIGQGIRGRARTSDILQSSLYQVVKSIGEFRGETEKEFLKWVGRIVENTIRNKARYFAAEKRDGEVQVSNAGSFETHSPGPESKVAMREEVDRIGEAMQSLPDEYRDLLAQKFVTQLSHKEIAERTGKTVEATRIMLYRARAALALELDRLREEGERKENRAGE